MPSSLLAVQVYLPESLATTLEKVNCPSLVTRTLASKLNSSASLDHTTAGVGQPIELQLRVRGSPWMDVIDGEIDTLGAAVRQRFVSVNSLVGHSPLIEAVSLVGQSTL